MLFRSIVGIPKNPILNFNKHKNKWPDDPITLAKIPKVPKVPSKKISLPTSTLKSDKKINKKIDDIFNEVGKMKPISKAKPKTTLKSNAKLIKEIDDLVREVEELTHAHVLAKQKAPNVDNTVSKPKRGRPKKTDTNKLPTKKAETEIIRKINKELREVKKLKPIGEPIKKTSTKRAKLTEEEKLARREERKEATKIGRAHV